MQDQKLYAEKIAGKVAVGLQTNKWVLLGALLFGLLAHSYAMTNKLINHDDVAFLFGLGATLESGRWGLKLLEYILPNCSMPWINGILTLGLIGCAVCIMTKLFEVERQLSQFLLGALVISFPSLTGTFSYMFTSSAYGIAFLLATAAAWLAVRGRRGDFLIGMLLTAFSLGIYQAWLALTAGLLVLAVLQKLLRLEQLKVILVSGLRYFLFLVLSLGVYLAIHLLVRRIWGVPLGLYAESSVLPGGIAGIVERIPIAIANYIMYFVANLEGLVSPGLCTWLHYVLLAGTGGYLVLWSRRAKNPVYPAILLLILLVYFTAVNCLYLVFEEGHIHTLVLYGVVTMYLLFILVLEDGLGHSVEDKPLVQAGKKLLAELCFLCMLGVAVSNTFLANQAYLKLQLKYENTYAFYTSIVGQLREREDFDSETKLAILGDYSEPWFYDLHFSEVRYIVGIAGVEPAQYSQQEFLRYYLGLNLSFASEEEIEAIVQTPEFAQMPCYPYSGSMEKIGSCIVVKLSNVDEQEKTHIP